MSMYDKNQVEWMWRELEGVGVKPLQTAEDVDQAMTNKNGTLMVVINSVCGCAAGAARPGVALALQNDLIPDRMTTVFAGVDKEATEQARGYFKEIPPSSPSVALFKDGRLVHFVPRNEIEGYSYEEIADKLKSAFNEHCSNKGPSVPFETLKKVFNAEKTISKN